MSKVELDSTKYTTDTAMDIIDKTVSSHEQVCREIGIFSGYKDAVASKDNIGGVGEDQSRQHLLGRFLNSAARTQLATLAPDDELSSISDQLLSQLYSGTLYIIDIAAGHGAGVISMINSVWHLRAVLKYFPTDRLDIHIHALDYSEESLSYYSKQLVLLQEDYASFGIKTYFYPHQIDLTDNENIKREISSIRETIGEDPRFLLVCSAISGVKKIPFRNSYKHSYEFIIKEFKQKNSLFFWVEPLTKNQWMHDEVSALVETVFPSESDLMHEIIIRFHWKDPHIGGNISTGAEFYLINLAA